MNEAERAWQASKLQAYLDRGGDMGAWFRSKDFADADADAIAHIWQERTRTAEIMDAAGDYLATH